MQKVSEIIDLAVNETHPDLTPLLHVPIEINETRRKSRQATLFFERVEKRYEAIASTEPKHIQRIDGTHSKESISEDIWQRVEPLLKKAQASR